MDKEHIITMTITTDKMTHQEALKIANFILTELIEYQLTKVNDIDFIVKEA